MQERDATVPREKRLSLLAGRGAPGDTARGHPESSHQENGQKRHEESSPSPFQTLQLPFPTPWNLCRWLSRGSCGPSAAGIGPPFPAGIPSAPCGEKEPRAWPCERGNIPPKSQPGNQRDHARSQRAVLLSFTPAAPQISSARPRRLGCQWVFILNFKRLRNSSHIYLEASCSSMKMPTRHFHRYRQDYSKVYRERQKSRTATLI